MTKQQNVWNASDYQMEITNYMLLNSIKIKWNG